MKLSNIEKRIIRYLFSSNDGLFTYTLYRRLKISPGQIFLAVSKLNDLKLINNDNEKLILSSAGREYALKAKIRYQPIKDRFSNIPVEFIGPKVEINEFYMPNFEKFNNSNNLEV